MFIPSKIFQIIIIVRNGDENGTGIFQNIEFGEIIVLAGIVGGFQIILAIFTFLALRRKK